MKASEMADLSYWADRSSYLESELSQLQAQLTEANARVAELELGLRNVRAFAIKEWTMPKHERTDETMIYNPGRTLVRFCDDAGVTGSVLRSDLKAGEKE